MDILEADDCSIMDMKNAFPRHSQSQRQDFSKKDCVVDERIDSGYMSGEITCLSVDSDHFQSESDTSRLNSGSLDITNRISKLHIENDCSNQFDSGISEEIHSSSESNYSSKFSLKSISSSSLSTNLSREQLNIAEIFTGDEDGDSHLHLSIIYGSDQITNEIISLAPDWDWLNQANNLLQTPLHLAVITRQAPVVRRLMCAGASVDVRDEKGNTPLHNACRLGFEDIVRMLLSPVLFEETYQNRYETPFQRVPQDMECKNYEGLTPLHLAAIGGHINVMRLLLGAGANVNTPEGKNGRTVLHMAADWGHLEMLKFLLQRRDVNIDADTYAGLTPIILAFGRQHYHVVEYLFKSGASYDIETLDDDSDMDSSDDEMSAGACIMPSGTRAYMQTCR